jgi:hypothetical protein
MKTSKKKGSKKDPEAKYRRMLAPLAEQFVRATPERRRQEVANMLPRAEPQPLRLLAEVLIERLDAADAPVRDGAADTLVLLGPHVLPTIRCALVVRPTEQRLTHLARVVTGIGPRLSEKGRTDLLLTLMIAEKLAPTPECRAERWATMWSLGGPPLAGHEAEMAETRKREAEEEAELLARSSARPPKRSRPGGGSRSDRSANAEVAHGSVEGS